MSPTLDAFLRSWPWSPWFTLGLLLTIAIYLRGWWNLRLRDPQRWPITRLLAFGGGLLALFLALASPIEPFASLLLQMHMLQHLLLMMVAPPLIWLGAPLLPLLRGLPRDIRRTWFGPLLRSPALRQLGARLTHPLVALPLFTAVTWLWHLPRVYDAALRLPWLHYLQHVSFLGVALLFWYPVVRPYPSRPRWSPWLLLPYLLLADVQNTVLSAMFTFSEQVLYVYYTEVPRIAGLSALDDQASAGVLMWVPGSIAFLGPLAYIGIRLLSGADERKPAVRKNSVESYALPVLSPAQHQADLLRIPIVGRWLRTPRSRTLVQIVLLCIAALVMIDGFRGPQVGAMNLAGVLPWIHWRGLLVLGLLLVGNVSCYACPFTLPHRLLSHWLPTARTWPKWLRNKWLAVLLVGCFLWAYEAYSLWDRPWLTAAITLAYFVGAFLIDSLFRSGSFCKYVCPIGQFNFVQSLISPWEIRARSLSTCASCRTHDCLRTSGNNTGCELQLFVPRKQSNLDCTLCLDCVTACPHDNVGLIATLPGRSLWDTWSGSGIGQPATRLDVTALVTMLVFGAFANAAGMVGPVVAWQQSATTWLGLQSGFITTSLFYVGAIVIAPVVLTGVAAALSRWLGNQPSSVQQVAMRYALTLIPLGFGMWLAHYSFHFLTSWESIVPVTQRLSNDLGLLALGAPLWSCACCKPLTDGLLRFELVALDLGFLASLYCVWRVAQTQTSSVRLALQAFLPWATLLLTLFVLGIWIVFQPMEMRGTLPGGG